MSRIAATDFLKGGGQEGERERLGGGMAYLLQLTPASKALRSFVIGEPESFLDVHIDF